MKSAVCFMLVFIFSACLAQITFTREWVKGKRATTANPAVMSKDGHTLCRSLVSAVEYLIELEKMRRVECSECCHSASPTFPVLQDIQRSPSDYMTYVRDIPTLEQDQLERGVNSQARRNQ